MKKHIKKLLNIYFRYILLLLLAFLLPLFYKILIPLTVYSVYLILNIFYNPVIMNNTIIIENSGIEIINACVAGSAYLLLLILNLSTPMKKRTRILSIIFSLIILFLLNIFRILILYPLNQTPYFDITHKFFWYFLSTIFVFLIWILTIKIFKIKKIPIYSDIKYLIKIRN